MFAIIEEGGKQYKVAQGTVLDVERIPGEEGDKIVLARVLLINNNGDISIGAPLLSENIEATILKHHRGEKIKVFKMKAKKRYRKTQGHRQELTRLEIIGISGKKSTGKAEKTEKAAVAKKPAKKPVAKKAPAKKSTAKKAD